MGVARQPHEYNWRELEFNETLLLPRNYNKRTGTIQFFAIHHMIILNRNKNDNEANRACYDTWINQGREASANYGVDGDFVDQFVYDGNAAWANANYWANHNCLSIEHANATFDEPGTHNDYVIDDRTFFNGARLVANGHLKYNIKPKRNVTVRKHKEFYATGCPGPYMDRNWDRYFDLMMDIYNQIKAGRPMPKVENPQRSKPQPAKLSSNQVALEVIRGVWGNGQDRVNRLRASGYNPEEIQKLVNNHLKQGRKSMDQIASEVIRGVWGNGTDRYMMLKKAGYDPDAVQRRVNQLLR